MAVLAQRLNGSGEQVPVPQLMVDVCELQLSLAAKLRRAEAAALLGL